MELFAELLILTWLVASCSQPLSESPRDFSCTFFGIFASSLALSTSSARRRAHSVMPTIQWFVWGPLTTVSTSPVSAKIEHFEWVAPLTFERKDHWYWWWLEVYLDKMRATMERVYCTDMRVMIVFVVRRLITGFLLLFPHMIRVLQLYQVCVC